MDKKICGNCALIGKHRYHDCLPESFTNTCLNIGAISIQLPCEEMSVNPLTIPYWLSLAHINYHNTLDGLKNNKTTVCENIPKKILPVAFAIDQLSKEGVKIGDINVKKYLNTIGVEPAPELLKMVNHNSIASIFGGVKFIEEYSKETVDSISEDDMTMFNDLRQKFYEDNFKFSGFQLQVVGLSDSIIPNTLNHLPLVFDIRVGQKVQQDAKRQPFALSIVLDHSGSMAGTALTNAKKAISGVIDELIEGDLLHLIAYSSNARVVFSDGNHQQKQLLKDKLANIYAEGSTNLEEGLKMGFAQLKSNIDLAKKMFVFSDGFANVGVSDTNSLSSMISNYYEAGVGTSSFGLGVSYDELLMKSLAKAGHGTYFFVQVSNIKDVLDKAIRGLSRTVATEVSLVITPSNSTTIYKDNAKVNQPISIPDLREKDLKSILLTLDVFEKNETYSAELFSYKLTYNKLDECIPDSPVTGTFKVNVSNDYSLNTNDEVLVQLRIKDYNLMNKEVSELVKYNKFMEAYQLKQKQVEILSSIETKDKVGYVKGLLLKAKKRAKELYELATAPKIPTVSHSVVMKACTEEEDQCEDLGFDLFG